MNQKTLEEDNIIPFEEAKTRLKANGKGPPPPNNWLLSLEEGTVFMCGTTYNGLPSSSMVEPLQVMHKTEHCVHLKAIAHPQQRDFWVNSYKFVIDHSCDEILGVIITEE